MRGVLARAALNHLWRSLLVRASAGRDSPLGPPLTVAVGLTTRCTYRCVHCHVWREGGPEYDTARWASLLSQLARWMGPGPVAFAGGEPFLRPDLGDLVRLSADLGLLPSVVTNGAIPLREREVASWPLVSLTVSLDSLSPQPHDLLHRAPGAHQKAMRTLLGLRDAGMGPRLRVATVLTGLTVDEVIPLARWTAEQGIGGFSLQPLGQPFGSDPDPSWYSSLGLGVEPGRVAEVVARLVEGAREGWPVLNPRRQLELLPAYYEDPMRFLVPCGVGLSSLGIGPSGQLRFCPYLPAFGHADAGSLRDQWRSPQAARVRAMVRSCTRGCSIMNCTFQPPVWERLWRWWKHVRGRTLRRGHVG